MPKENRQKFTPGPWHVGMRPGPIIYGEKGEQVADLCARLVPDEETRANARLITAAPELLAALRAILAAEPSSARTANGKDLERHEERQARLIRPARAAIAKATGGES